jgi:hypothetical protein
MNEPETQLMGLAKTVQISEARLAPNWRRRITPH